MGLFAHVHYSNHLVNRNTRNKAKHQTAEKLTAC